MHGTANVPRDRQIYHLEGEEVELWEDPNFPFGWGLSEMSEYATKHKWVLLFNAMVLDGLLDQQED
ncbi:MAG: hypothetical protein O2794_03675 [bacterium]|nr:hypothetical protein [bacterium]